MSAAAGTETRGGARSASGGASGGGARSGARVEERPTGRIVIAMACFALAFGSLGARLVQYGLDENVTAARAGTGLSTLASRPDLLDRDGRLLATDIRTASLFAEPRRIVDADEAVEKLTRVLPGLDRERTRRRLSSDAGFVWLKRELTPRQQALIHDLGIPGVHFRAENRRFYPGGATASHVLGHVDVDNKGIAGFEKYVDREGLAALADTGLSFDEDMEPVRLSIDLRAQHALRDELAGAMERYRAIAAGGVVLNAKTGEVVAMASLPDYDPNDPVDALKKDRLNRMSAGTFEMGSTFKAFTTAMALDSGLVKLGDSFDATKPIRIARHTINDFHAKRRWLSVPEVFIYSSNIGTAKMADVVGVDGHRDFLAKLGLLDRMSIELPEVGHPIEPKTWKKINSVTISFGHGVTTTPLQTAVAAAALLNGGKLIPATFVPRSEAEADAVATRVLKPQTSSDMRYLFRLNVEKGSGRRADIEGYHVGGKTGTAEKVVNGRYSSSVRFNAFLAGFPMHDPQYVVLVFVDEPKPEEGKRSATAGLNAAPTLGNVIRRVAPLLGVEPDYAAEGSAALLNAPIAAGPIAGAPSTEAPSDEAPIVLGDATGTPE